MLTRAAIPFKSVAFKPNFWGIAFWWEVHKRVDEGKVLWYVLGELWLNTGLICSLLALGRTPGNKSTS
jgi:hypothetical protein